MSFFKNIFRNRRQEELEQVAYQHGMAFSAKDEFSLIKRLEEFKLFKIGHSRKIRNLMTDQDSWLESSFEGFSSTTRNGRGAMMVCGGLANIGTGKLPPTSEQDARIWWLTFGVNPDKEP